MKKTLLLFSWLLATSVALIAQPANDLCQNAISMGSPGLNQQICAAGTNVGANPEFPYPFQNNCGSGGSMASAADDVWYTITTPTGSNELVINLTGTLSSYNIGIYSGSCGSLSGLGCSRVTNAGGINTTIRPTIQNTTYYIQVSGNGTNVQGTFNLCIRPQENANLCVVQSNITANPPPTNGSYNPGTVVTFCYSVTDFTQQSANWFHGVSIQLGGGWQAGSLTPVSGPASCDGNGVWLWRNLISSSATGNTAGPGYFYDSNAGGPLDGNPGNNYGDNCSSNTWTFCFTATVPNLAPNQCLAANTDLSVSILQYGDGQTGSWSSLSCTANPPFNFSSILECCEQPLITVTDESCPNACDGAAIAVGQGGIAPYTYAWSNATTSDTVTSLCDGPINVTVTDALGCDAVTTVIVNSGGNLNIVTNSSNETCAGAADGKAWVVNASASLTYVWNTVPPQNGDTAYALTAGTYQVIGTGLAGCADTTTVTVGANSNLTINLGKRDITCNGLTNGKAWVISGNANFTYNWNTIPAQSGDTAFNLGPGIYELIGTGPAGCADTVQITIVEPTLLAPTATADTTNCGAAGSGNTYAVGVGGTPPYSFAWNSAPPQNTATATNLPPATYTATVTDANGCSATVNATVVSTPSFTTSTGFTDINCNGANNGKAWAVPSGGQPPFNIVWSTVPVQNTDTAFNLAPGIYGVTITDINNCSDNFTFVISEPAALAATPTVTNVSCNGLSNGAIALAVSGGTPPYFYAWSNSAVSPTNNGLIAGSYDVDITDNNGCLLSLTNITVTEPAVLTLTATPDSVLCYGGFDGSIALAVNGGTPPYGYRWSNGRVNQNLTFVVAGIYSVTVTDRNGCKDSTTAIVSQPDSFAVTNVLNNVTCFGANDGSIDVTVSGATAPYQYLWSANSNSATGTSLSNLDGATYVVTITDNYNCTTTRSYNIFEPTRFRTLLSQSIDSTACDGTILQGSITNNTNGGTPPFNYIWSSGDTTKDITSNLVYGTYTVTSTDANGCTDTVDVTLVAKEPLSVSFVSDSSGCFGDSTGSAEVIITGGRKPYFITWADLDSTNTKYVGNLGPGNYDVMVVDSKGCDTSINFTITEQPAMSVSVPDTLTVIYGYDTTFTAQVSGVRPDDASSIFWNPSEWMSCDDCVDPVLTAIRNRAYVIELNVNGCLYYDTLQLMVNYGPDPYYIPNAFTPNGDGVNDFYQIFGIGIKSATVTIFNRWGGQVFYGDNLNATWDGTHNGQLAQTGTYVYNVYIIYLDQRTETVTGSLMLLR